ncbi:MAG TPA: hypothetical protein DCO72_07645 [Ruminococcus sp.]|nr:hypothetical protein [Ruminococcus sp.]
MPVVFPTNTCAVQATVFRHSIQQQFQKVAETGMSDAQLYKQAGNAVTVNVVEAIGRNLQAFDRKLNL